MIIILKMDYQLRVPERYSTASLEDIDLGDVSYHTLEMKSLVKSLIAIG